MRKILTFLFAALMSAGMWADSGTCGPNLTWNLTGGVLTISGTGDMYDYDDEGNRSPWIYDESITSVIISNGVTSIGQTAFFYCTGLTSVTIPNSVTSIGNYAFCGCAMTSITIPNSVISIGERAFASCTSLTSITIPNSVESIGNYAFRNCTSLTTVTIPNGVTSIGDGAFGSCSSLTSIIIPNSVTSIGYGAFGGCSGLTSVTIPNSVTSIGNEAFQSCTGLTSITIPNSVTSLGIRAFQWCTSLTSVTIGNGIESIADWAFRGCAMTSITIPNGVTSIGYGAFYECEGLTSVTNYAVTPQTIVGDVFYAVNTSSCTLYVPEESIGLYDAKEVWTDFIIQAIADEPATQEITPNVDPQNASVYYSTFYDSTKKCKLPAGVEAYVATISEDALLLTKIAVADQVIPNDNAVILKSTKSSFTLTPSDEDPVTFEATNNLQGSDASIATPDNCYVLAGEDGVGFYQYTGTNLNPHKAYVLFSGSNAPRRMRFVYNNEQVATGVTNTNANANAVKRIENGQLIIIREGVRYNAQGQRMD